MLEPMRQRPCTAMCQCNRNLEQHDVFGNPIALLERMPNIYLGVTSLELPEAIVALAGPPPAGFVLFSELSVMSPH
jgi:hypothetical protein